MTGVSATSQAYDTDTPPRDYRFALIAAVSWGAVVVVLATSPPLWIQGGVCVLAGWGYILWRHHRVWAPILGAIALAGVTLGSLAVVNTTRAPAVLVEHSGQPMTVTIELTATAPPGTRHLTGTIHRVGATPVMRVPVMLYVNEIENRLPLGTRLHATARLSQTPWWDRRGWVGHVDQLQVVAAPPAIFAAADSLRESFLERSMALGGDAGALLPGLSLGDTTGVPGDLESDMRRAALAHLVAVSGANCALVVGCVVWLTALAGGSIRVRFVTGSLALAGFVVLVTPEPSVIRAAVMAVVVLFAVAIGRPFRGLPVLALVVWVLLLLDPWRALELAFVLSVAATAGILLGFRWWAGLLERFLPSPLAWFIALPLSAQLAVQPIVILLRPTLPVWGVVANVLAAPAAPLVTLFGLLGSLVGPLSDALANAVTWLGWFPAAWIAAIARTVADLPIVEVPWIPGIWGSITLGIATVMVIVGVRSSLRSTWWSAGLGLVVAGVLSQSLPAAVTALQVPAGWTIAQCDVGQGDAVLYRSRQTIVAIDTGDDPAALSRCLQVLRVKRVDVLVLTHFDNDHVGATEVFHGITHRVLTGPTDNEEDDARLRLLAESGAEIIPVVAGDRITLDGGELAVIWPTRQPLVGPGNPSSVVVTVTPTAHCGSCPSLIALGDLDESAQRMVQQRLEPGHFDVVKVSHHGSPDQFPALYESLGTHIALIGVGADNGYGHPAPAVMSFLSAQGHTIVRSDIHGISVITQDHVGRRLWHSGAD